MLTVVNGPTIHSGEAESDSVDCTAGQLVRITMPTGWDDDAPLTFLFSSDGVFFNDMYGLDGYAATLQPVVPGAGVIIPGDMGRAIGFLKVRSGSKGNPVAQMADRAFAVTLYSSEAAPSSAPSRAKTNIKRTSTPKKKKSTRR